MSTDIRYTVVPKDCLWNLAGRFYGDATLWPLIFEYNNLPDIVKRTGSRILDPDLILIGQILIIPDAQLARRYGQFGLDQVKSNISHARQEHSRKGAAEHRQIRRIEQTQPQPARGAEPMGQHTARRIIAPAYEFDLGKSTIAESRGPGYVLTATLGGKLIVQSTQTAIFDVKAKSLDNLEISSKHQTETVAGKLISELKFDFDSSSRSVKLSGGIASQSNIKNAPLVKMEASLNALGQPAIKGSVIYDIVEGHVSHYAIVGEKIRFDIEITLEQQPGEEQQESNIWEAVNKTIAGSVLVIGAVWLVAGTLIENIITSGAGLADDPVTFAIAARMIISGGRLLKGHTLNLGRQMYAKFLAVTGVIIVTPIEMAKSTGLLDTK